MSVSGQFVPEPVRLFLFACSDDPPGQPFHRLHLDLCPAQLPKASSAAFISRWPSAARREASSSVKSSVRSRWFMCIRIWSHRSAPWANALRAVMKSSSRMASMAVSMSEKNLLGKVLYFPAAVKSCHQQHGHNGNTGVNSSHDFTHPFAGAAGVAALFFEQEIVLCLIAHKQ